MDTRKFILYSILGFVCFMLWEAWQKDYPPVTQITNIETAQHVAPQAAIDAVTADSGNSDVKSNKSSTIKTAPISSSINVSENRLVKVHTDILDVAIDKIGGNVVQAKLLNYPKELHSKDSVQTLSDKLDNLYLAESSLISTSGNGPDINKSQARYTVEQNNYALQPNQEQLHVKLKWKNDKGITVDKIFTFKRGRYDINISYVVDNKSKQTWSGQIDAQLKRKNTPEAKSRFQYSSFTGAAISSSAKLYEKIPYKKLSQENLNRDIQGGWLALQQRYFFSAWIPEKGKTYHYYSNVTSDEIYTLGLKGDNVVIPSGEKASINATLYSGPEVADQLKTIAPGLELTVDYGWLWIISIFLFWVMQQIYRLVGNWGWSIILVTILIKLAFFKLSETSYRSMARMKDLAPKIQALKERLGEDKQKLSQATMELYRKEKINPLGGCLPMLIQIPVFIGLYYVLVEAVELRQAPFMLWIHDLSVQDPYYILPILMGISMFLQQRLSPQSPDPIQAKMMMFLPVIFTVFFLSFPSGLVLYWLVNNCLSILQQWYINKKCAHIGMVAPSNKKSQKIKVINPKKI